MSHEVRNQSGGHVEQDFWDQYASSTPKMTLCVKVTPLAEWVAELGTLGFTTNSRSMTLAAHSGITFQPTAAATPTEANHAFDAPSVMELMGIYESGGFTEADVLSGKWDGAEVEVFSVCWDDETLGEVVWHKGDLSQFTSFQTHFNAESRGLLARFSGQTDVKTTKICRALRDGGFRGSVCGHTASTVTIDATDYDIEATAYVFQAENPYNLIVDFTDPTGVNDYPINFFGPNGKITSTVTTNGVVGISREIEFSTARLGFNRFKITLRRPFPWTVADGLDEFLITAGCAGTIEDCIKYDNIERRRAEDWVPGIESANRVLDAR